MRYPNNPRSTRLGSPNHRGSRPIEALRRLRTAHCRLRRFRRGTQPGGRPQGDHLLAKIKIGSIKHSNSHVTQGVLEDLCGRILDAVDA